MYMYVTLRICNLYTEPPSSILIWTVRPLWDYVKPALRLVSWILWDGDTRFKKHTGLHLSLKFLSNIL